MQKNVIIVMQDLTIFVFVCKGSECIERAIKTNKHFIFFELLRTENANMCAHKTTTNKTDLFLLAP